MKAVFRKIHKCWERMLCIIMVIFCVLCMAASVLFVLEMPKAPDINGKKPGASRIFPWDSLSGNFYTPSVPDAVKANPFYHVFTSREKPVLPKKKPESPAAPDVVVQKKAAVAPVKVASPPPVPEVIVSVIYKGYYVDVRGEAVALITVSVPSAKESKTIMCKLGEELYKGISLEKVGENSATFRADGLSSVIKWMETREFRVKK